ncbi:MAG TPA: XamI family restriction endonuclease [Chloroflexi bacterium]|nr:XamI family restriction endonuclease [Chloroflexota bacterium]
MPINLDKPHLWKADVSQSIDYYNDWFLRYAPETYRSQRSIRIAQVQDALDKLQNLRDLSPQVLYDSPGLLSVLCMTTAPPLARDRLMGLSYVSKSLIESMEGKESHPPRIPPKLPKPEAESALQSICDVIGELIDRDLFVWLKEGREPTLQELDRAVIVVADRLSGAIADPLLRNAQEQRQLAALKRWLLQRGYTEIPTGANRTLDGMDAGTFAFHMNVYVGSELKPVKMPIDCVIKPFDAALGQLPIMIEAKSAGDVTNTNKRRKEEAQKITQLRARFGNRVVLILLLCGYFDAGYLGYEASEGIDWVWEHRLDDLDAVCPPRHWGRHLKETSTSERYSTVEHIEKQRFAMQKAIDTAKSSLERNRLGQFSTPYALARQMMAATLVHMSTDEHLRFLEPSVGSGVFFSALLAELDERVLRKAVGIEIDQGYLEVAEALWRERGLEVVNADFLTYAMEPGNAGRFNLLCTNPPYVRHHHLDPTQKVALQQVVRAQLGLLVSGLAGLYVYFVLLADAVLAEDAVASWLLPTEFFTVNYGSVLRQYLAQRVTLLALHQFDPDEVQFDDALVSSCIVTYRKRRPNRESRFVYTYGGNVTTPSIKREVMQSSILEASRWTFSSETPQQLNRRSAELYLGDLFSVKRGIATGANDFFIITPETVVEYEIPAEFLKPILPGPRYLGSAVIERNESGAPLDVQPLYLLACTLPPEVVEQRHPGLWSYLQRGVAQKIHERYLCASKEVWYYPERRQPSLFLATYMGRVSGRSDTPIRFYLNLSDALVTNVFLHLYPRSGLMRLLAGDRRRMVELLDALNRITITDVVQNGRFYGGGLHKVEPKELITLPLLHPPDWLRNLNEKQLALIA